MNVLRGVRLFGGPRDGQEIALDPELKGWPIVLNVDDVDYLPGETLAPQEQDGVVILSRMYIHNGTKTWYPKEVRDG